MATEYDIMSHTHVTVDTKHFPDPAIAFREGWGGTFPIVLHTGNRVWVEGSHMHDLANGEIVQVTDGDKSKSFDDNGQCILSVPAEWCKYYTEGEAENIEQAMDADARLLSYAR